MRKKRKKQKWKRMIPTLLLVCMILLCVTAGIIMIRNAFSNRNTDSKQKGQIRSVKTIGTLPESMDKDVLKNDLITGGVKTEDGYLKPGADKQAAIEKYDNTGKRLWGKTYSYDFDRFAIKNIISLPDGGFVFTVNPVGYKAKNGKIKSGIPTVFKCDGDGNQLWLYEYPDAGDAALERIFVTKQGEILTAGYSSSEDILLTKLNADGEKTEEKTYGGSGSDTLKNAAYTDSIGLSVLIDTNSKDGTFSAAQNGNTVSVAALFKNDLSLDWQQKLSFIPKADENFFMNKQGIYTVSEDNMFTKFGRDGTIAFQLKMNDDPLSLTKEQAEDTIVAWNENKLFFFDAGGSYIRTVPYDAGRVLKAARQDNQYLIVSDKNQETLYSGYDADGNFLWRAVCK